MEGRKEGGERRTFEIGAGAEGPPGAGHDPDAQGRFVVEPFPDGVEFVVAGDVDAVEGLGPVECHAEDGGGGEGEEGVLAGWRWGGERLGHCGGYVDVFNYVSGCKSSKE